MKGLFILFGECFRQTKIASDKRVRDTINSIEPQISASQTHNELAKYVQNKYNCSIDIAIHTYITKYIDKLLTIYENVKYINTIDQTNTQIKSQQDHVFVGIQNIKNNLNIDNYDFIFICRLDILIKSDFYHIFSPYHNTIMYPNVMSIKDNDINNFCISDVFCFIPKKYYSIINQYNILFHSSIQTLLKMNLIIGKDIDFYTDQLYIANTAQQNNPLYCINNRTEGLVINCTRVFNIKKIQIETI